MKRVFVTGNAGSGKTTVSNVIGNKIGVKAYGLDKIVWKSDWKKTPEIEKVKRIKELCQKKTWIIDGVSMEVFKKADTVIFLDFSRTVCYFRVIKRNWRYLFTSRPGLPLNSPEILIIKRLTKIIWNFPKNYRSKLLQAMKRARRNKKLVHIRSTKDLNDFLLSI